MRRPQQLVVKAAVVLALWAAMSHALPAPGSRVPELMDNLLRSASEYRVEQNGTKAWNIITRQVSALDQLCKRPTVTVMNVHRLVGEHSEFGDQYLFPSRLAVPQCGPCVDAIGRKKICSPVMQKRKQYIIQTKKSHDSQPEYVRLPVAVHRQCECRHVVQASTEQP